MPALLRRHLDLLLIALIGALCVALPQADLAFTGLFYDPWDGFFLSGNPLVRLVYNGVPWVTRTVVVALVLFLLAAWTFWRRHALFVKQRRAALYLLLVMIVGPGLLVNGVFKDHWGRARPSQVVEFGGDKQFTRAAVPADQCEKNCSFVGGHASVGFFFLAFAFVVPRRRVLWLALGTGLGLGIGLVRIMQGGHFLSDIVFSGIIVYLSARVLHDLLLRAPAESRA
jgi:lipid A 4'-phosphatase